MEIQEIPLKVLVCDHESSTSRALESALQKASSVRIVSIASTIREAQIAIRGSDVNAIFIDASAPNIVKAAEFIFSVRKALPEIVFVLYIDLAKAESRREYFYAGERHRFSHYYTLDKNTPMGAFESEVLSIVRRCRVDLSRRMSEASLVRLAAETHSQSDKASVEGMSQTVVAKVEGLLEALRSVQSTAGQKNTVFVSYRFAESELVDGLKELLSSNGFIVVDGLATNSFIGQGIIQRIRESEFFLCLMTKYKQKDDGMHITSPWLLEEKGAALALNKRIVLMVEEGVDEIGGLQGDWQRIAFTNRSFLKAAMAAVKQLRSYSGNVSTASGDA